LNGNGANRKGRPPRRVDSERKESQAFFSKNQPLPSLALFAFFAVQVFAVAFAVHSAFRIPHFAFCRT
jgi:hypothetical protein